MSLRSWGWVGGILAFVASAALCAGGSGFLGKVAVEWEDDDSFNRHRLTLLADFGFQDNAGRQWLVKRGAAFDGSSFAPLFVQLMGLPFAGEHRRAGILHDYFSQQLDEDWKAVRRMYYEALLAEGLSEIQAKTVYAVAMAAALRWEQSESGCYNHCHTTAAPLRWRPDVTRNELEPVLNFINSGTPSLDAIDTAVERAVPRPGPHLFAQLRPEDNAAIRRGKRLPGSGSGPTSKAVTEGDDNEAAPEFR